MRRYIDRHGTGAITHFERGIGSIKVRFANGRDYTYTDQITGVRIVQRMQQLAESGKGLGSFILKNKPEHARKA